MVMVNLNPLARTLIRRVSSLLVCSGVSGAPTPAAWERIRPSWRSLLRDGRTSKRTTELINVSYNDSGALIILYGGAKLPCHTHYIHVYYYVHVQCISKAKVWQTPLDATFMIFEVMINKHVK